MYGLRETSYGHQIVYTDFDPHNRNFQHYFNKVTMSESGPTEDYSSRSQSTSSIKLLSQNTYVDLSRVIINQEEKNVMMYTYQQAIIMSQVFRILLLCSTFLVCLSHGSNDTGNAISPLVYLINLHEPATAKYIPFLIGSLGIMLGLMILGQRVMNTVGKNVIKLDYMKGYSTQFAAGISVCIGSLYGIPLSTTHCIIGGLAGVYITGKLPLMVEMYQRQKQETSQSTTNDYVTAIN